MMVLSVGLSKEPARVSINTCTWLHALWVEINIYETYTILPWVCQHNASHSNQCQNWPVELRCNRTLYQSETERDYWDHQWVIHGNISLHYPVGFAPRLTSKSGDPYKRSLTITIVERSEKLESNFLFPQSHAGATPPSFWLSFGKWVGSWSLKVLQQP